MIYLWYLDNKAKDIRRRENYKPIPHMNISTDILSRAHNPMSVKRTAYMTNQDLPQECKEDSIHTLTGLEKVQLVGLLAGQA